ncbi:hypothetical protein [Embleya sp. NPDC050493]
MRRDTGTHEEKRALSVRTRRIVMPHEAKYACARVRNATAVNLRGQYT